MSEYVRAILLNTLTAGRVYLAASKYFVYGDNNFQKSSYMGIRGLIDIVRNFPISRFGTYNIWPRRHCNLFLKIVMLLLLKTDKFLYKFIVLQSDNISIWKFLNGLTSLGDLTNFRVYLTKKDGQKNERECSYKRPR